MGKITKGELTPGLKAEIESKAKQTDLADLQTNIEDNIGAELTNVSNELSAHKADNANIKHRAKEVGLNSINFTATNTEDGMNELFTNVSDGKQLVGNAITGVDDSVVIPIEPSFGDLAGAIGGISTGKKWASGSSIIGGDKKMIISNLPFRPTIIHGLMANPDSILSMFSFVLTKYRIPDFIEARNFYGFQMRVISESTPELGFISNFITSDGMNGLIAGGTTGGLLVGKTINWTAYE